MVQGHLDALIQPHSADTSKKNNITQSLNITCHENTRFHSIKLNSEEIDFHLDQMKLFDRIPLTLAMTHVEIPTHPLPIQISYSCKLTGNRAYGRAFWDGLTPQSIFVRPDETYYPSPAENPFEDYLHTNETLQLRVVAPSDWQFTTNTYEKPIINSQNAVTEWFFANVSKPPLLVGGSNFRVLTSKIFPATTFWTMRQEEIDYQQILTLLEEIMRYYQMTFGELTNAMLYYIETPPDYNGYVQNPLLLMDEGALDELITYSFDDFTDISDSLKAKLGHIAHEIAHRWFPGETRMAPDILGLWGESFTHLAEVSCLLNHFHLNRSYLDRFIRQYRILGDLQGQDPPLSKLTQTSLQGKAWGPVRRGKAVIVLFGLAQQLGWRYFNAILKKVLELARDQLVSSDWLWKKLVELSPKKYQEKVKTYLAKYVIRSYSLSEFNKLCEDLELNTSMS